MYTNTGRLWGPKWLQRAETFHGKVRRTSLKRSENKTLCLVAFSGRHLYDLDWKYGRTQGLQIDYLNNLHPTIKFTSDLSKTSVAFLDTTVSINNCKVSTDLYVKPTDTHQYLLSSSCHPYHTKRSIPYNLGLRLRRICSGDTTFRRRCDELSEQLRTETGLRAITGTTRNHQSTTCYTRSSLTTEPLTTKT